MMVDLRWRPARGELHRANGNKTLQGPLAKETETETQGYTVDLLSIESDGRFPCPRCGAIFDPDDYTETIYVVLDVEYSSDKMTETTILCLGCKSEIRVTGLNNAPS